MAVVFFSEGNDGGGWWWSTDADETKAQSTSERQLLDEKLSPLEVLIQSAVSARVFGIACRMNLRHPGSVKKVFRYLNRLVLGLAITILR